MNPMLNVDTALANILADLNTLLPETVSLPESLHRVLADDIISPIDLPPFDNSAMDGYAVHVEDCIDASPDKPVTLPVVMDIPAGSAPSEPSLESGIKQPES